MQVSATLLREHVQTTLGARWDAAFVGSPKPGAEALASPLGEIPRGALTEIAGPASSGRTSLLHSLLAVSGQDYCAFLDCDDQFDPVSAAAAGVKLSQLLWVRCGGNAEHALKAADMLAQAGGFGLIALDLGSASTKALYRIPTVAWFRLRHTVENTRTALVVLTPRVQTHSCSALKIRFFRGTALWEGDLPAMRLKGLELSAQRIRNHQIAERVHTTMPGEETAILAAR